MLIINYSLTGFVSYIQNARTFFPEGKEIPLSISNCGNQGKQIITGNVKSD
jgi:hypothetical protein